MIDLGRLPREGLAGLMLNIESLQASDDLRQAKLMGAVFGGKNGSEYLEFLASMAHWDSPEDYESVRDQIAISDSSRGLVRDAQRDADRSAEPDLG